MNLLCFDIDCKGHDVTAGEDPEDCCRFCGAPLLDDHGCVLASPESAPLSADPLADTDLEALAICSRFGHSFEGRVILTAGRVVGRCAQCGVGIVTDGC